MKRQVQRDMKRRRLVHQYELKRLALRSISRNEEFSRESRLQAQIALSLLPRDSSKVRVRNRCVITGRGRSTYADFKISRIVLREMGLNGLIPGLQKASW